MELQGFPLPENSPEAGACVRIEHPEPELAVLTLTPPHRSLAVLDGPLLRDLDLAVAEIERGYFKGVVIAGAEPLKFAAGADIDAIQSLTAPADLKRICDFVHDLFLRIDRLPGRVVAAIGGPVPGGAFELSLACDYIVAADHAKTRIGLPETMLGILPGWGGCHRLPRRIGLPAAMQAILTGRLYPAKLAKKLGMVDRLTHPEYLLRVACDIAMGRETPRRSSRGWKGALIDRNPLMAGFIARKARETVHHKTRGNYPAPLRAIDVVAAAPRTSLDRAARIEGDAIAELATGPVCKALISIFRGSEDAKKLGRSIEGFEPRRIRHAGVLGGGVMGGGIASSLALKGVATRLFDLAPPALDAVLQEHRKDVAGRVKKRRLSRAESLQAIDHLDTTRTMNGFGRADIVIEAVAERLDVKQSVFQSLAEQVSADCILASNTSSLSISRIAEGVPHPERVVGMHFFNPVKKMPLVEVVQGDKTTREIAIEVAALAVRLGKTPVIVRDVAGFLVNRLLGPYLDEAVRLFVDGAQVRQVDNWMLDFGMPMGPFRLLDEVGLDIAAHASDSLHEAYGERMIPCAGIESMRSPDRLGRKTGKGFYVFPKDRKARESVATDLANFQSGSAARRLERQQVIDRLVLSMVNEAARCLEEEVVASAAELDLATVFGTGFAPFHGGLLHYADKLGAAEVVARLENIAASPEVADRPGGSAKFEPAAMLRDIARRGASFFSAG